MIDEKKIIDRFLFFMIFGAFALSGFQVQNLIFGFDFRMWQVPLLLIGLILAIKNQLFLSKRIIVAFMAILFHLILIFFCVGSVSTISIIQVFLIVFTTIILYSVVARLGLKSVLSAYYAAALFLAVALLLESILFLIFGLNVYSTGSIGPFIRARGMLTEPSEVSVLIAPAIFIGLVWKKRLQTSVLVISVVMSFSSLSYLSMLMVFYIYLRFHEKIDLKLAKKSFGLFIVVSLAVLSPNVQERFDQMYSGLELLGDSDADLGSYQELAGSAATLIFNANIAIISLFDTNGLGVGFGAFRNAFDSYANNLVNISDVEGLFYNRAGGGSLLIRVTTELGIFGLLWLLYTLLCIHNSFVRLIKRIRFSNEVDSSRVLAIGLSFVILMVYFVRKDMWFSFNLIIFICLYIYATKTNYSRESDANCQELKG